MGLVAARQHRELLPGDPRKIRGIRGKAAESEVLRSAAQASLGPGPELAGDLVQRGRDGRRWIVGTVLPPVGDARIHRLGAVVEVFGGALQGASHRPPVLFVEAGHLHLE